MSVKVFLQALNRFLTMFFVMWFHSCVQQAQNTVNKYFDTTGYVDYSSLVTIQIGQEIQKANI